MYPNIEIPRIPAPGEYFITLNLSQIKAPIEDVLFKALALGFKPQVGLQAETGDLIAVLFYEVRATDEGHDDLLFIDEKAELNHLYGDALQCRRGLHKRHKLIAA